MIIHQKRTIEETDQVRIPWKQVHSAHAKTSQKVHKSAQNTPGNHPPTTTPSTTYEAFPAKTPHPPPFLFSAGGPGPSLLATGDGSHITQTAKALGLERSHLYKKCQQLGIDLKAPEERDESFPPPKG